MQWPHENVHSGAATGNMALNGNALLPLLCGTVCGPPDRGRLICLAIRLCRLWSIIFSSIDCILFFFFEEGRTCRPYSYCYWRDRSGKDELIIDTKIVIDRSKATSAMATNAKVRVFSPAILLQLLFSCILILFISISTWWLWSPIGKS